MQMTSMLRFHPFANPQGERMAMPPLQFQVPGVPSANPPRLQQNPSVPSATTGLIAAIGTMLNPNPRAAAYQARWSTTTEQWRRLNMKGDRSHTSAPTAPLGGGCFSPFQGLRLLSPDSTDARPPVEGFK